MDTSQPRNLGNFKAADGHSEKVKTTDALVQENGAEAQLQSLLNALKTAINGDLTVRLAVQKNGLVRLPKYLMNGLV